MSVLLPKASTACCVSRPLPRQKMRELVLQILYALVIDPVTENGLVPLLMAETAVAQKYVLQALSTAKEILEKSPELDLLISKTIKSTSINKLTLMERNVLRLTLFEYLYGQPIDAAVLIAEATRLVKKFSYIEACSFIHAVLNDAFRLSEREPSETSLIFR